MFNLNLEKLSFPAPFRQWREEILTPRLPGLKDQKQPPKRIASISLSETGVRFGWTDAFPPTAVLVGGAGTSDSKVIEFSWLEATGAWETEPELDEFWCLCGNLMRGILFIACPAPPISFLSIHFTFPHFTRCSLSLHLTIAWTLGFKPIIERDSNSNTQLACWLIAPKWTLLPPQQTRHRFISV